MQQRNEGPYRTLAENAVFGHYLRTGIRYDMDALEAVIEAKFNPWHDPDNGQFANSATGVNYGGASSRSGSAGIIPSGSTPLRNRKIVSPGKVVRPLSARLSQRRNDGRPVPGLSPLHNEVRANAVRYPAASGTKEWSLAGFAHWQVEGGDVFSFKRQWVRGHRDVIRAAARRFDIPPTLLAGVAFTEVGGDPLEIDQVAYGIRDMTGNPSRDRTSFGNLSVQFRRAASTLGYKDVRTLTGSQRAFIISSLRDPQTSVFIAAKHLSDLRDMDFRGESATLLSKSKIEIIATRYNRGTQMSRQEIENNLGYGRSITKRWSVLNVLLR